MTQTCIVQLTFAFKVLGHLQFVQALLDLASYGVLLITISSSATPTQGNKNIMVRYSIHMP